MLLLILDERLHRGCMSDRSLGRKLCKENPSNCTMCNGQGCNNNVVVWNNSNKINANNLLFITIVTFVMRQFFI